MLGHIQLLLALFLVSFVAGFLLGPVAAVASDFHRGFGEELLNLLVDGAGEEHLLQSNFLLLSVLGEVSAGGVTVAVTALSSKALLNDLHAFIKLSLSGLLGVELELARRQCLDFFVGIEGISADEEDGEYVECRKDFLRHRE